MGIHYETAKFRGLLVAHENGKLVLPNFQREFVWNLDQQRGLLTSVLADIPIGSILLLRGSASDFVSRRFGRQSTATPAQECSFLLDGQQRLSCIAYFLDDPFGETADWESAINDTFSKLRYRWLVKVAPAEAQPTPDPFGYAHLSFKGVREEPEALRDFVVPIKINEKEANRHVVHPAWFQEQLTHGRDEGEIRLQIARELAERGLVPLWEIRSRPDDPASLHGLAVRLIAAARADELKARTGPVEAEVLRAAREVEPQLVAQAEVTYADLDGAIGKMEATWVKTVRDYLDGLAEREVPQVILPGEEIDRAIPIFEVMNQGGTPLTTYDLVVAKMARASRGGSTPAKSLTDELIDLASRRREEITDEVWDGNSATRPRAWNLSDYNFVLERGSLSKSFKDAFLNLLSITAQLERVPVDELETEHIKRGAVMKLKPEDVQRLWRDVAIAVSRAWAFLNLRCGIRSSSDLRNKLILIPLGYILMERSRWGDAEILDRLEYWYWCSVLAGTYASRQNDNCIQDIKHLHSWLVEGGENPLLSRERLVLDAESYSARSTLLREDEEAGVASDVSEYVAQYVLSRNPYDFLEDNIRLAAWDSDQELELHHVIPLRSATTVGESTTAVRRSRHILNSPLNKTYILKKTNRRLRDYQPDRYVEILPEAAPLSHFFPSDPESYAKREDEEDEDYYKRILENRYEHLWWAVNEELGRLRRDVAPGA